MVFGRRKSIAKQQALALQAEAEAQAQAQAQQAQVQDQSQLQVQLPQSDLKRLRGNRLSKPQTNNRQPSFTTSSAFSSSQDLFSTSSHQNTHSYILQTGDNISTDELGETKTAPAAPTSLEARREIKALIFDQEFGSSTSSTSKDQSKLANETPRRGGAGGVSGGVASMISKFESNNAAVPPVAAAAAAAASPSCPSTPPTRPLPALPKTRRRLSNIFGVNNKPDTSDAPELPTSSNKSNRVSTAQQQQSVGKDDSAKPKASSSDTLANTPYCPPSRRASFRPGTATRKSVVVEVVQEDSESANNADETANLALADDDDDARSFCEGDDDDTASWYPPPQITRTETPNGLDYTHLGGLRLGSLRIVNGRASPAASDMSRLPLAAKVAILRRDVSSDYGSEPGGLKDRYLSLNSRADPSFVARSRDCSGLSREGITADTPAGEADAEPQPRGVANTGAAGIDASAGDNATVDNAPATPLKDASAAAAEYISVLPASPYNSNQSFSVDSPAAEGEANENNKAGQSSRMSSSSLSSYSTISPRSDSPVSIMSDSPIVVRSHSPVSVMSDTGSVLQRRAKTTESEDELEFEDVGDEDDDNHSSMLGTIPPDPEQLHDERDRSQDSRASWHSALRYDFGDNEHEAFDSAVEFQNYSPNPPSLPMNDYMDSPVLGVGNRWVKIYPFPHEQRSGISDSGYSSSNSVKSSLVAGESSVACRASPVLDREFSSATGQNREQQRHSFAPTALTKWPSAGESNPAARRWTAAPAPAADAAVVGDTADPQQSNSASPARGRPGSREAPKTPGSASESTKPKPKKLQKKSFLSRKKKVMIIQRVASIDMLSVPQVSPEMKAKLDVRASKLPELRRTVNSVHDLHHSPNRDSRLSAAGAGNVNNDNNNIRFPSPTAESEPNRDIKKQRQRSLRIPSTRGRHASWFAKQKTAESKDQEQQTQQQERVEINERETRAIISGFGTMTISPYDIAKQQPQKPQGQVSDPNRAGICSQFLSPAPQSQQHQQQQCRLTFDASDLTRLRSRSVKVKGDSRISHQPVSSPESRKNIHGRQSGQEESEQVPRLPRPIHPKNWINMHQDWYEQPRNAPPTPPAHSPSALAVDPNSSYFDSNPHHNPEKRSQEQGARQRGATIAQQPGQPLLDGESRGRGIGKTPPRPPRHSPHPIDISPRQASPRAFVFQEDYNQDATDTTPPPPPSHSPRPMDVWPPESSGQRRPLWFHESQDYFCSGARQWDSEAQAQAQPPPPPPPPPPSHSPRPEDIWPLPPQPARRPQAPQVPQGPRARPMTGVPRASARDMWEQEREREWGQKQKWRQEQNMWDAQAAMWRARRQSAGETLKRHSWQQQQYQYEEEEEAAAVFEPEEEEEEQQAYSRNSYYPPIPRRSSARAKGAVNTRPHTAHAHAHAQASQVNFQMRAGGGRHDDGFGYRYSNDGYARDGYDSSPGGHVYGRSYGNSVGVGVARSTSNSYRLWPTTTAQGS